MADRQAPDINIDRNSPRISTEEARRRAEAKDGSSDNPVGTARHGGAGKMGMDRTTADEQHRRTSLGSQDSEQSDGPNEEGDLEKSSGHP